MMEVTSQDAKSSGTAHIGGQRIALAAAVLVVLLFGAGGIGLWRAYTGNSPELDRAVVARQLQASTAQASDRLAGKTKDLEAPHPEASNQFQSLPEQLQTPNPLPPPHH